jgi:hypothetical protein
MLNTLITGFGLAFSSDGKKLYFSQTFVQFTVEANGDVVENKQVKRGRKQGQVRSYWAFNSNP